MRLACFLLSSALSAAALLHAARVDATVNVGGSFNGASIPTPCAAEDISYSLATGVFTFACNGLTYTCSAPTSPTQWVNYLQSTPPAINITCVNGTAVGLQVDIADFDGQRTYCVAASSVGYQTSPRKFNFNCGVQARECYPNTPVNFDISNKTITIAQCSSTNPLIFVDSFD